MDFPRNQSNCPVEASRLQLTHASERAAGAHVTSTQTAINPKEQGEDNIWFQESLLGGQQLKPEQCNERSGSQRQSEPLVFEGADHVAIAVAPIKRAFNQKPTSGAPRRYRCKDIGSWRQAQELLAEGHRYLDGDGDGEACESLK